MNRIRILVADDHEIVLQGIRMLLQERPEWEICAQASNGRLAVEQALLTRPDVAVLDLTMPELNGLDAARQLIKALPHLRIIILSVHASEQLAREIAAIGAHAYVLKSDAGYELITAIDTVLRNGLYFPTKLIPTLPDPNQARQSVPGLREPLTQREREVLQLVAEAKSNKEVATALHITVKTVETHRANIMHKLQLHSIAELVHYAVRNKIISP